VDRVRRRLAEPEGAVADALAPPSDGVDLVDEDDALAAPLAREPPRLGQQELDDDHVHPDECLGEARAGHRDDRRVEARRDALGEHRLAGARRADEQQAALGLAARLTELLAGLPQRDHARDLLLGLGLAADVGQLHAPVGVARLVALHLLEAEEQQWPE
jgi:hypothetical protein